MRVIYRKVILALLGLTAVGMLVAGPVRSAPAPAESATAAVPFRYVVNAGLVKTRRTYAETDGTVHNVALVQDDKGVISSFVEDEIVVRDDPAEVRALVETYHARALRQITVNMISTDGKPLPPVHTTPMTVLQLDATSSLLRLEQEAPTIKLQGTHAFSSAKSANLAAIFSHERAAGHHVELNFLSEGTAFPIRSKEQADQNGVSDAYKWPEFDHRAWQYVAAAGIKSRPTVAIIDGGFWLTSTGVPCGYRTIHYAKRRAASSENRICRET